MQVFDISIENLKTVLNGFGFKVCNLYDEIMIKGCPEKIGTSYVVIIEMKQIALIEMYFDGVENHMINRTFDAYWFFRNACKHDNFREIFEQYKPK